MMPPTKVIHIYLNSQTKNIYMVFWQVEYKFGLQNSPSMLFFGGFDHFLSEPRDGFPTFSEKNDKFFGKTN